MEGSHGIRVENQLVVKKLEKNLNGQFVACDTISPYLNDEEKEWLKEYTRAI